MFIRYPHLERLNHQEVEDILLGNVFIFPKLDGTNASVWFEDGQIHCGSRNNNLKTIENPNDNHGFKQHIHGKERIEKYKGLFTENPDWTLYGEFLCLSGDTLIKKTSGGKRKSANSFGNYMTLKEMYTYLNEDRMEKDYYKTKKENKVSLIKRPSWWKRYGMPSIYSLNLDTDIISGNKIKDIFFTGIKDSYKISTRLGYSIKSSLDHPFLTGNGWTQLKNLKIGDTVAVCELTHNRNAHRNNGVGSNQLNKLMKEFKISAGKCKNCEASNCLELDHIDEDWTNNDPNNWQVLCSDCHRKKSAKNKKTKPHSKGYSYYYDNIISIEYAGQEEMYDIKMEGDECVANFVANNFIVHNCPHTLKTYRDSAWRKFYLFDILDRNTGRFVPYNNYVSALEYWDIEHVTPLAEIRNPSEEQVRSYTEKNTYLIEDGKGLGEGIVIKNYDWTNKYGRQPWAKVVRNEFRELNQKEFGHTIIPGEFQIENAIADKYVTEHLVNKTRAKIEQESKERHILIPQLLNRTYYEIINEELWTVLKEFKNPIINFKKLQQAVFMKVKELAKDIF